jgi:Rrf2 family iron-sulfur cluster assembly transcriptional regulator
MISRTGVHAIRALVAIADVPEGRRAGAAAVAREIGAPPNYLGKLLQKLGSQGLVEAVKGQGGGFRLARPAASIRLIDIVEPLDPSVRWRGCLLGRPTCSDAAPCATHGRWARIRDRYIDLLSQTTVADLVAEERGVPAARKAPRRKGNPRR